MKNEIITLHPERDVNVCAKFFMAIHQIVEIFHPKQTNISLISRIHPLGTMNVMAIQPKVAK